MRANSQSLSKILMLLAICLYVYFLLYKQSWNYLTPPSYSYQRSSRAAKRIQPEQKDWQPVAGSEYHFSVYSAYHILGRSPPEVLVIGTARRLANDSVSCRIYFPESHDCEEMDSKSSKYIEVPGTIQTMQETWNRMYAGVFIHCPLSGSMKPEMVSVLLANQTEPSNLIQIQHKSELEPQKYNLNFSLCVHPIYKYNEVFHFLEWIEFYKLMGVEQITLYNVSIGPDTSCVLQHLMEGNDPKIKVNVYPWHDNPIKTPGLIRGRCPECALSAGSNDCLYRHRGRVSKYMVFVDLDEYILPRETMARNYPQLIEYLDAGHPEQKFGHYLFKNGFFLRGRPDDPLLSKRCSEFQNDPLKLRVCSKSLIMSKVWREPYQPYRNRSKYIIKPEGVKETGTHFAYFMEDGYLTLKVPENIAFSRHYRHYDRIPKTKELDRAPTRLGMGLVNSVGNRMKYLMEKCKLHDKAI